jgi:hypothetical protein
MTICVGGTGANAAPTSVEVEAWALADRAGDAAQAARALQVVSGGWVVVKLRPRGCIAVRPDETEPNDRYRGTPQRLTPLRNLHAVNWDLVMARTLVFIAPVIVLCFFAQKASARGITPAGVNG